jgi:hypothetical protein
MTTQRRPHAHLADTFALAALERVDDAESATAQDAARRDRLLAAAGVHATLAVVDELQLLREAMCRKGVDQMPAAIVLAAHRSRRAAAAAADAGADGGDAVAAR